MDVSTEGYRQTGEGLGRIATSTIDGTVPVFYVPAFILTDEPTVPDSGPEEYGGRNKDRSYKDKNNARIRAETRRRNEVIDGEKMQRIVEEEILIGERRELLDSLRRCLLDDAIYEGVYGLLVGYFVGEEIAKDRNPELERLALSAGITDREKIEERLASYMMKHVIDGERMREDCLREIANSVISRMRQNGKVATSS